MAIWGLTAKTITNLGGMMSKPPSTSRKSDQHWLILDATTNGSLVYKICGDAISIIEAMTLSD
ncbi:hypothetical protein Lal_00030163 [Lupinus albus]|nr:hypothetical protein Lal_00030163 [Lupinus albus]